MTTDSNVPTNATVQSCPLIQSTKPWRHGNT